MHPPEEEAVRAGGIDRLFREKSRGDGAPGPANPMNTEGIQGVVVSQLPLDEGNGGIADHADAHADEDGVQRGNKAAGRGDGDQTGHGARDGAQNGRCTGKAPLDQGPGQSRRRCRRLGRHEGVGGQFIRPEGASRIEPEPAEPQERAAQDGERQVVRTERLFVVADPFAQHQRHDQGGNARTHMDDDSAGKIEGAQLSHPAAHPPDPVGQRIIDQGGPEDRQDEERGELHPFRKGADDQGRGDDGEHRLKDHKHEMGNGGGVVCVGGASHPLQSRPFQGADDPPARIGAESQRVSVQNPLQADHAHDGEALHEDGKDILPAHQAAIEKGQAGRHDKNQYRGYQDPRRISCIHRSFLLPA